MLNRLFLDGIVVRDPELRQAKSKPVCNFTIAQNTYNDESAFFDIVAWDKKAEAVAKYLHKGSHVTLECNLNVKNSKKNVNGQDVYTKEVTITVSNIVLDGRGGNSNSESNNANNYNKTPKSNGNYNPNYSNRGYDNSNTYDIMDDDVQF